MNGRVNLPPSGGRAGPERAAAVHNAYMVPSQRPPKVINPLWIVSLFLSFAQFVAGVAATQVADWKQGALVVFVIAFPVAVMAAFFAILWKRPYVLYAPGDFTKTTSVSQYVDAMNSASRASAEAIEDVVRQAIGEALSEQDGGSGSFDVDLLVEQSVEAAHEALEERAISVKISGIDPRLAPISIQPTSNMTVQDLLNRIWFYISDYVQPYSYGTEWYVEFREPMTKDTFIRLESEGRNDVRKLRQAGILPGGEMTAEKASKSGESVRDT